MSNLILILSNSLGLTPPIAPPTLEVPRLSSDVTDVKAKNCFRRDIVVLLNTTSKGRVNTCIL